MFVLFLCWLAAGCLLLALMLLFGFEPELVMACAVAFVVATVLLCGAWYAGHSLGVALGQALRFGTQ